MFEFLSVWGAIVSTLAAAFSIIAIVWNFQRDQRKIEVSAMIGKIGPLETIQQGTNKLIISIVNVGNRPVNITGFGGKYKKQAAKDNKVDFLLPEQHGKLPVILKDGETHSIWFDVPKIVTMDVEYFCVFDSYNNKWKISKNNLKFLREDVKENL